MSSDESEWEDEVGYVLPYLYFGSYQAIQDRRVIKTLGITHIFSIVGEPEHRFKGVTYRCIDGIRDRSEQFILNEVLDCDEFINAARLNRGIVLVNCRAGISRSSTLVIGHLILTYGFSYHDALDLVRVERTQADPNKGFRNQLRMLDRLRRRYEGPNHGVRMDKKRKRSESETESD